MASWKVTLKHDLVGREIPVKLKYEGGGNFPQISCTIGHSYTTVELSGWNAETLDSSKIKFVSDKVVVGNVTYNLKSLVIQAYQDGSGGSGGGEQGGGTNETNVDIDGTVIDSGTNETNVDIDGTVVEGTTTETNVDIDGTVTDGETNVDIDGTVTETND